jgi:hypothetical protein
MAAHDIDTVLGWRGSTVVDRDGEKIGTFEELYLDQADRPAWGAVNTGLFGMRQTFVPLSEAQPVEQGLQVPFEKDHVKSAPNIDPGTQLTGDEEEQLHRHYGLSSAGAVDDGAGDAAEDDDPRLGDDREAGADRGAEAPRDRADGEMPDAGTDATREDGPTRSDRASGDAAVADDDSGTPAEVTRSEEELIVGTRKRVRGRARLKKYVVTEHVQRTVPVQREEVRVEYDPPEAGEAVPEERRDTRDAG